MSSSLQSLLASDLVLVELGEVVHDDRDGEGDDEDPADAAEDADGLAHPCHGHDVAIADGGHGDGGPPERVRDADELLPVVLTLGEEGEAGEDENAHRDEHEQQAELLVRVLDGEAQTLESCGMSCQLEDP